MIESLQLGDLMPIGGVVTRLTRTGKSALVRIRMAGRALPKGQTRVFHIRCCIPEGNMALRARCFFMRPGKRIFCLGVAEQ